MLTDRQQQIWNYLVELRRPSRLSADGARDRRGGRPRLALDGARAPREPRARRAAPARPDQAARARADRPRAAASRAGGGRAPDAVSLPLLGEIAAGGPLLAEQNVEDYLTMPSSTKGDFLLRVKGESMIEAGILDGDLVIVAARPGRAQRRDRGRARRRRRVGRRGDGQDLLPRERPRAPPARERRARADLRRPRPDPRPRRGGVPRAMSGGERRAVRAHARAGAGGAAPRRLARVPRLRRVRHARPRGRRLLPRVRLPARRREAAVGRELTARIRHAGRVTAGLGQPGLEESPDTAGQDAGASQAAKADGKWNRKETAAGGLLSGDAGGKGETVG